MTPQELKNSILQLAIQGKLVEQREDEGTAEELYKQIQSDSIATVKTEPTLSGEDLPFDIPDTWKFVRIENIAVLYNGRAYKQNELKEQGKYPVLRVGNLFTNNKWYFSDLELEPEKYCDNGDLLYSWSASFGPHIWTGQKVIYHYHIWKIEFSKYMDQKYLYYFLLADTDRIKQSGHGLAMIHVTKAGTEKRVVPLPPLAEQKRIVAKIEELLPLIERYEKAWSRLEDFNKRFPGDMQKSILQMAIQGKLVEQLPEEGTGEELYKKIQAEKQALIKAGKIKKEKPLPEITEDDVPFDIPESWKWVYIGDIFLHNTGKAQNASGSTSGTIRKFITTSNLYWGYFDFSKVKEMPFTEQEIERCSAKKGDLLVCEGGDCGRSAIWNYDEEVCIQNHVHRLRQYYGLSIEYYYYLFYLYKFTGRLRGRGVAIQGLSSQALHKVICPLPPLAEQKRIIALLEELLPLCESLK